MHFGDVGCVICKYFFLFFIFTLLYVSSLWYLIISQKLFSQDFFCKKFSKKLVFSLISINLSLSHKTNDSIVYLKSPGEFFLQWCSQLLASYHRMANNVHDSTRFISSCIKLFSIKHNILNLFSITFKSCEDFSCSGNASRSVPYSAKGRIKE